MFKILERKAKEELIKAIKEDVKKTIQKWEENADSMSDDMVCEDDGLGGTECGYSKKYVKKLKKELNKILDEALK